jgi:hypothetical protein
VLTLQILAVVRFFQDREAKGTGMGKEEDEVWEKMGHAGPTNSPLLPSEMTRENSREAQARRPDFANPVSRARRECGTC